MLSSFVHRALYAALEEQRDLVQKLQHDLELSAESSREREACDSKKISDLTREVDVLKNQLKKYVAAVQSMRKEPNSDGMYSATVDL